MIFRQFNGQFPMPVWFEVGVPQSWAWTLLAPYITSCPANSTRVAWQNFPSLTILNQPNPAKLDPNQGEDQPATGADPLNSTNIEPGNACYNASNPNSECGPAITNNRTIPLSYAGRPIHFSFGEANQTIGPNNSYITTRSSLADAPRYAMFVSQLNTTYVPLVNITNNGASAIQPNLTVFEGDPAVNGTMFIAITSENPYLTPYNLSMINPFVYAGPALYQAG